MLTPMRRIDIVARADRADEVIRAVHRTGLVHLVPFDPPADVGPGAFAAPPSLVSRERRRAALDEVARLAGLLGPAVAPPDRIAALWEATDEELDRQVAGAGEVAARVERLTAERQRLASDLARLQGYLRLVEGLRTVVGRLPAVRGYGATGIIVRARHRAIIPIVREELEALTDGRCEVIAADLDADHAAAILLYPTRSAMAVASLLGGRELEELSLPPELQGIPFDQLVPRIAREASGLEKRLAQCNGALAELGRAHGPEIAALRLVLADRLAEAAALEAAGHSDHLAVVSGWAPADRIAALRSGLAAAVGDATLVVERGTSPADRHAAPVALANGPVSRAFEPLSRFVAVPRYGTIDPTPIMAVTLPAFVGLMIGDVGYGVVILAALMLLRWRYGTSPRVRALWPVGLTIAISTIAFGLLFGEAFGESGRHLLGIEPIAMDRADRDALIPLLVVTLLIGVAQVGLGLLLGVVNAASVGHRREAVARAALLGGLAAALVAGAAAVGVVPRDLALVGAAALLAAVVISALAVGIAGPVEMIGVMGSVLSYARLMAIAVAGVMLALVAQELGSLMPGAVFAVLVAVLIHALNLGLGLFDASIQGLRLHYVEFFGKFLEPGGTPYAPFTSALGSGRVGATQGGS
jgi:V/A-type H+-transporting ATPase subunit I